MTLSLKELYDSYYLVPIKGMNHPDVIADPKQRKAPTVSIVKYANKKIPWSQFTTGRVGIQTGYDGVEVIDIDNHFGDAEQIYNFICDHFDFEQHPIVKTESGGYHIYIKSDYCGGSVKLAMRSSHLLPNADTSKTERGDAFIETRGKGGYVCAPPTAGYELINGSFANIPKLSEEQRAFLFEFLRAQNEYIAGEGGTVNTYTETDTPGSRYCNDPQAIEECASLLRSVGWKTNGKYCTRPGKDKGISATLGKVVSRRNGWPMFHVFSGCNNFAEGNHTLFGIYAKLAYNGDFAEATRDLAKRYGLVSAPQRQKTITEGIKRDADSYVDPSAELDSFIRVGTAIYKIIEKDGIRELKAWNRQTLMDDFGKDAVKIIQKFDDFVNVPSHTDYKQVIGKYFNLYAPAGTEPANIEGKFPTISHLLTHIFGESVQIALDWIQIAYLNPLQRLPILCLISAENSSGKGTFSKLMRKIFGYNYTSLAMQAYASEFNGSYATKNIVDIVEVKLTQRDIEKLKKDSTDSHILLRKMQQEHVQVAHFAKYILQSNHVTDFLSVTQEDDRFWIVKVPKRVTYDPDYEAKINDEAKFFLKFLLTRKLHVQKSEGRFWIGSERYITEAFRDLVRYSRPSQISDIYEAMLSDIFSHEPAIDAIHMSAIDIKNYYAPRDNRISTVDIRKSIKDDLKLEMQPRRRYSFFQHGPKDRNGPYFEITKAVLLNALGREDVVADEPAHSDEWAAPVARSGDYKNMPF